MLPAAGTTRFTYDDELRMTEITPERLAAVDEDHSAVDRSEDVACKRCRSAGVDAIHGFVLDPDTWTGEDIFFARGLPGTLIATNRFREFVERNGLTNIRFTPTESYEWDSMAPISGLR